MKPVDQHKAETTGSHGRIACPHCGHEKRDLEDYECLQQDEGLMETECEECDKPFRITVSIQVDYTGQALLSDDQ